MITDKDTKTAMHGFHFVPSHMQMMMYVYVTKNVTYRRLPCIDSEHLSNTWPRHRENSPHRVAISVGGARWVDVPAKEALRRADDDDDFVVAAVVVVVAVVDYEDWIRSTWRPSSPSFLWPWKMWEYPPIYCLCNPLWRCLLPFVCPFGVYKCVIKFPIDAPLDRTMDFQKRKSRRAASGSEMNYLTNFFFFDLSWTRTKEPSQMQQARCNKPDATKQEQRKNRQASDKILV